MKKIMILVLGAAILASSKSGYCVYQGKLNWSYTSASPLIERELHDGQFLYGAQYTPWSLQKDGSNILDLGAYGSYDAQGSNASYGLALGFPISDLAMISSGALGMIKVVPSLKAPKWLSFVGQATQIEVMGGYRPIHDASVNGNLTYGVAAVFKVGFDAKGHVVAGL